MLDSCCCETELETWTGVAGLLHSYWADRRCLRGYGSFAGRGLVADTAAARGMELVVVGWSSRDSGIVGCWAGAAGWIRDCCSQDGARGCYVRMVAGLGTAGQLLARWAGVTGLEQSRLE